MPKFKERGIAHILLILILLAGLAAALFLIKNPTFFRPKASAGVNVVFVDSSGNVITQTTQAAVKVKLTMPDWSTSVSGPTTQKTTSLFVKEALAQSALDTDGDGFSDALEQYMGTDPKANCSKDSTQNAWPPDFDNNRLVNISDFSKWASFYGSKKGDSKYNPRYDLNADGKIDFADFTILRRYFGKSCQYTPPPSLPIPKPIVPQGAKLPPCGQYGDVNLDGVVSEGDAQVTLQIVAGKIKNATPKQLTNADVDGDGKVTSIDALFIKRYVSGLDSTFKVCGKASPTPFPTIKPTPVPTVKPTSAPVTTVSATLAEDPNFSVKVKNVGIGYTASNVTVDYTFSNPNAGTKTLYVKFKSSDGRVQNGNPYPATISLVAPTASPSASPSPFVKVTYPNGGQSFKVGDSVKITWDGAGSNTYSVDLYKPDTQSWQNLAFLKDPSARSYSWTVNVMDSFLNKPLNVVVTGDTNSGSSDNVRVQDYSDGIITVSQAGIGLEFSAPQIALYGALPGQSNQVISVKSIGATQFSFYGYPTSFGSGINWKPSSGSVSVGQSIPISIEVASTVSPGTYTGTGVLKNAAGQQITIPVSVEVSKIATSYKRIFVTSTTYNANLGGLSGADSKCQERANAANLGGTWKAWLSDSATSAASRLSHSSDPYKLVDGSYLVNNWSSLTAYNPGTILVSSINANEFGTKVPSGPVWTNTSRSGDIANNTIAGTCNNWTALYYNGKATVGNSGAVNLYWTQDLTTTGDCSNQFYTARLYCFEQ